MQNRQKGFAWVPVLVAVVIVAAVVGWGYYFDVRNKNEALLRNALLPEPTVNVDLRYKDSAFYQDRLSLKNQIKSQFGIAIYDNDKLDLTQLRVIYNILKSTPTGIHDLKVITVRDFIGDTNPEPGETRRINIFGLKVGTLSEDSIPDNIDQQTDTFSIVFAHELNHRVSWKFWNEDVITKYKSREKSLLSRAGYSHLQYVRSMFDNGFFQNYPQEFFASLSNAYFQDSHTALRLGIERFHGGYREPINQVLFILDVYSQGSNFAPFYTLGKDGRLTMQMATLKRNSAGQIYEVSTAFSTYSFTLDASGFVTAVN